jgi:radical SAM superfamily enzyme YgiQ (UPF0313 family)
MTAILKNVKDIKVTLLYPPNQTLEGYMCKPNGSLAYPNLAGALIHDGYQVEVFDACVGNEKDDLDEVFYRPTTLPSGLLRTGVSDERILEEVRDSQVVGLTSIFTAQENMVLETVRLIKKAYPEKLIVAGGVNARNRLGPFFGAGVDVVFLSEAERTLLALLDRMRKGQPDYRALSSIAFTTATGTHSNPTQPGDVVFDLDTLPLPAWHLLPNERYWKIGRPHGGHFEPGQELRYASMMTSMGCVFECSFCHIAGEVEGSVASEIGRFRIKSDERVLDELRILSDLGVLQLFIEDDTLFGKKRRAIRLLEKVTGSGFQILDTNGVNLVHLFRPEGGELVPDEQVLQCLVEAGFTEIVLAFESGSQRILKKYVSNKWTLDRYDIPALLETVKAKYNLTINGNYMLGYPDETRGEMEATIQMARRHREAGLDAANFFCVLPLPGTPIFDWAVADGYLSSEFDPDMMNWTKSNMMNTPVSSEEVESLRSQAWRDLNDSSYVNYKLSMNVDAEPPGSP